MKKTNKIFVVVVLALVVLFGVGQFFAPSNPIAVSPSDTSTTPSSLATSTSPGATQLIKYVPPEPASSTPVKDGTCSANSFAAPFRTDAWQCVVGKETSDPCFEIPQSNNLLCGINPTVVNSTSTFVLQLTRPLPVEQVPQGIAPNDWAWLIQLSDGTLCTPLAGTPPVLADGHSTDYECAPGPLGNDVYIFDDLNTSSGIWTATVGTLANSTSGLQVMENTTTVAISTIYQ